MTDTPYSTSAGPRAHADPWSERHAVARRDAPRDVHWDARRDGGGSQGWRDHRPGAALAGLGLVLAVGGMGYLAYRGRSEPRPADDAPGRSASGSARRGRQAVVGRVVTIARPRSELYAHWRDFQNLAGFMEAVEAVRTEGHDRHVWTLKVPGGTAQVRTEVTEDREGEVIAWASVEGSDVETTGRVTFRDAPGDRGTQVEAEIAYVPPGGEIGRLAAKLFQREPAIQARRELKRFKMLMEAGEIATAENRRAA